MTAILELSGVGKTFGKFRAVSGIDLVIGPGEMHALIGPNGAGKSTLLNLASGALQPSEGDIRLDGRSIAGVAPHLLVQAGIARSFQITSIFPRLSVVENVRIALMARQGQCHRLFVPSRRLMRDQVQALLEQVHMVAEAARPGGELAAGDRKRLEFAIALAGNPKIILLDEPTAGMSTAERALVTEVLLSLNRDQGVAVLFTEHDIDMVFTLARRITVMHQGTKIAEGTPASVRADPRVQELYLAETLDA